MNTSVQRIKHNIHLTYWPLLQFCGFSSLLSPQSLSPSQNHCGLMQRPLPLGHGTRPAEHVVGTGTVTNSSSKAVACPEDIDILRPDRCDIGFRLSVRLTHCGIAYKRMSNFVTIILVFWGQTALQTLTVGQTPSRGIIYTCGRKKYNFRHKRRRISRQQYEIDQQLQRSR